MRLSKFRLGILSPPLAIATATARGETQGQSRLAAEPFVVRSAKVRHPFECAANPGNGDPCISDSFQGALYRLAHAEPCAAQVHQADQLRGLDARGLIRARAGDFQVIASNDALWPRVSDGLPGAGRVKGDQQCCSAACYAARRMGRAGDYLAPNAPAAVTDPREIC